MRGLDDGPDGLNDEAFDRALGLKPKQEAEEGFLITPALLRTWDAAWDAAWDADLRKKIAAILEWLGDFAGDAS